MAGLSGGEGDDDLISGINVTPLVDIVLVLLIIFMVTATYIVRAAIEVELPRAATAARRPARSSPSSLTRDGKIYLDGVRADRAGARPADARGGPHGRGHARDHLCRQGRACTARSSARSTSCAAPA